MPESVYMGCRSPAFEFEAPTFRKGRERWGTPLSWGGRRNAETLRWEFLALPRTPLLRMTATGGIRRASSEDKAVGLAQEVPGFAIVIIPARAPVSLGPKPQGLAVHHLAHG